jgi:hypothetical protein
VKKSKFIRKYVRTMFSDVSKIKSKFKRKDVVEQVKVKTNSKVKLEFVSFE